MEVWKWTLCGYYYLLELLGGSEGMEVDIMWSGYYYLLESVFGGVWMWILCGYYYLLECFLGESGCLDVDILICYNVFGGCLDVWIWILCGYYYLLECFLGESGCLDVDKPK